MRRPWRLLGQNVAVRVTENELVIHDRAFIEATRHPLFAAVSRANGAAARNRSRPATLSSEASNSPHTLPGSANRARGFWRACSRPTGPARVRRNVS